MRNNKFLLKIRKNLLPLIFISFFIWMHLGSLNAFSQSSPNTITFDNKSGEIALVKLMGPTKVAVEVPSEQEKTVHASAGEYYILVRYGTRKEKYTFTKGDPFTITQSGRQYSIITITLHKVIDGNYNTEPVSAEEFNQFLAPNLEDMKEASNNIRGHINPKHRMGQERDPLKPRIPSNIPALAKKLKNPIPATFNNLTKGKALYEGKGRCVRCHGKEGKGNGPAAFKYNLNPAPRNFTNCLFHKKRKDGELFWAIKNGIRGTSQVAMVDDTVHYDDLIPGTPGPNGRVEGWKTLSTKEAFYVINYIRTFCEKWRGKQ